VYREIASNRRRTAAVIASFLVIWLAVGALAGLLFKDLYRPAAYHGHTAPPPASYGWSPVIIGAAVCAVLALLAVAYSLTAGATLVLRVSGAVPADRARYPRVHNLVESLAIGEGIPKPAVDVIDAPSPNAFATGVSPDKAAITFTTACSPS